MKANDSASDLDALYDSFTLLGQDNVEVDVEFALMAHRKSFPSKPNIASTIMMACVRREAKHKYRSNSSRDRPTRVSLSL